MQEYLKKIIFDKKEPKGNFEDGDEYLKDYQWEFDNVDSFIVNVYGCACYGSDVDMWDDYWDHIDSFLIKLTKKEILEIKKWKVVSTMIKS